jgi:hypothetical protein
MAKMMAKCKKVNVMDRLGAGNAFTKRMKRVTFFFVVLSWRSVSALVSPDIAAFFFVLVAAYQMPQRTRP